MCVRRLVVFMYQNYMMFFLLLQDYIRDLEKEEEEQNKVQKV